MRSLEVPSYLPDLLPSPCTKPGLGCALLGTVIDLTMGRSSSVEKVKPLMAGGDNLCSVSPQLTAATWRRGQEGARSRTVQVQAMSKQVGREGGILCPGGLGPAAGCGGGPGAQSWERGEGEAGPRTHAGRGGGAEVWRAARASRGGTGGSSRSLGQWCGGGSGSEEVGCGQHSGQHGRGTDNGLSPRQPPALPGPQTLHGGG